MEALERSVKVRQEADLVLQETRLREILLPYGPITFTGSYFLDVMVYPDIDLMIRQVSLPEIFKIGACLAACPLVQQVVFEKSDDPTMPGGLYLKPRITYGQWGRTWKIDIWSLENTIIEQKMGEIYRFKEKMTETLRQQIIRYKVSLLTPEQRTPTYSGYWIYKAFLDEGLTEFGAVTEYLISKGIKVR